MGKFTMKVNTRSFPGINMADWISRSTSRWQDYYDVAIRRGPVPAIGPEKAKGSTSMKNR
jgi:hypothetical protein